MPSEQAEYIGKYVLVTKRGVYPCRVTLCAPPDQLPIVRFEADDSHGGETRPKKQVMMKLLRRIKTQYPDLGVYGECRHTDDSGTSFDEHAIYRREEKRPHVGIALEQGHLREFEVRDREGFIEYHGPLARRWYLNEPKTEYGNCSYARIFNPSDIGLIYYHAFRTPEFSLLGVELERDVFTNELQRFIRLGRPSNPLEAGLELIRARGINPSASLMPEVFDDLARRLIVEDLRATQYYIQEYFLH